MDAVEMSGPPDTSVFDTEPPDVSVGIPEVCWFPHDAIKRAKIIKIIFFILCPSPPLDVVRYRFSN
jgi:hypothetical protein